MPSKAARQKQPVNILAKAIYDTVNREKEKMTLTKAGTLEAEKRGRVKLFETGRRLQKYFVRARYEFLEVKWAEIVFHNFWVFLIPVAINERFFV